MGHTQQCSEIAPDSAFQELFLVMLGGPYGMPRIDSRLAAYKVNALPTVLSVRPLEMEVLIFESKPVLLLTGCPEFSELFIDVLPGGRRREGRASIRDVGVCLQLQLFCLIQAAVFQGTSIFHSGFRGSF